MLSYRVNASAVAATLERPGCMQATPRLYPGSHLSRFVAGQFLEVLPPSVHHVDLLALAPFNRVRLKEKYRVHQMFFFVFCLV